MHLVSSRAEMQTERHGPRTHPPHHYAVLPRDKRNHVLKKHFLPSSFPTVCVCGGGGPQDTPTHSLFQNTPHALFSLSGFVLLSRGCYKKSWQTQVLKTTEMYTFSVPQRPEDWNQFHWAEIKVWVRLHPQKHNLLLLSSSFWWLQAFLCLWLHHTNLSLPIACSSPLCTISLSLCLIRIPINGLVAHSDNLE